MKEKIIKIVNEINGWFQNWLLNIFYINNINLFNIFYYYYKNRIFKNENNESEAFIDGFDGVVDDIMCNQNS